LNFSPFELAMGQQPLMPYTIVTGGGLPISLLCQDVPGGQQKLPNLVKQPSSLALSEERRK